MGDFVKSKITLEDLKPHITEITGHFGVPFNDFGFLLSSEEIEKSKAHYDASFIKTAASILGLTEEVVSNGVTRKNTHDLSKPYNWCWKHNLEYSFKKKDVKKTPLVTISLNGHRCHSIYFKGYYGWKVGIFNLENDGFIYQSTDFKIDSIEDVSNVMKQIEIEDINKMLKKTKAKAKAEKEKAAAKAAKEKEKAKAAKENVIKRLNTITKKVDELEKRLLELS